MFYLQSLAMKRTSRYIEVLIYEGKLLSFTLGSQFDDPHNL